MYPDSRERIQAQKYVRISQSLRRVSNGLLWKLIQVEIISYSIPSSILGAVSEHQTN